MDKVLSQGIKYDAIVFSNDDMALGAVKCFNDRARQGLVDVSQKCIICGFDDSINSSLINPSLTTVRQPIEEISMNSVELLLRKIDGEKIQDVINFLPVTVIRESCGCSQKSSSDKITDSYLRLWHGYRIHENLQTYSLKELFDSLTESLPHCNIKSCFISKYYGNSIIFNENNQNSICNSSFELPDKSELIYAFYNNMRVEIDDSIKYFQTKDLVPGCFIPEDRRFIYLAVPLFFIDEHFGFVVFEVTTEDVITFEPLRGQISNTLKGALMLLEREKMEKSLLESERLASLGQLIGGISHNLMTPIMSIAGVCAGLEDLIKEYVESIGDPSVSLEDHNEIAGDMMGWVDNLKEYNSYMCNVIKTVKNQAVRLNADDEAEFSIGELISQIKFITKTNARYKNYSINFNICADLEIELKGNIANLIQIFENLILNSIQSYEENTSENIIVDFFVEKRDELIIVKVKDYGKGIPDDIKNKIFKHMVTTKGKNGTGLSLLLSYSTIKGKFSGDMWFEPGEGRGTTFFVTVPIAQRN
ncbi:MAG: substrate-binding domain-containing protein [Clostridiaceae bacterium]|nr:substrate-binding domain-containing protein [Clostridiaceae bacterium]